MRRAARATGKRVLGTLLAALFVTLPELLPRELGSLARPGLRFDVGARAHASDLPAPSDAFQVPPPPAKAAPRFTGEVHTVLTRPLDNRGLCPPDAGCVLKTGGGVGISLERRYPSGFGGLLAYDVWFLDSDAVYELAVQQVLRGGFRYTMPTDYIFHPVFEVTLGAMGLGDIFRIQTGGVLVQGFSGVETELTESYGVRFGIGIRSFTHSKFVTSRDGVRRGEDKPFSETFFIEAGLTIM